MLATAVAVPLFVLLAVLFSRDQPAPEPAASPRAELPLLEVPTPEVSADADRLCPALMGHLPLTLSDAPARPVRSASPYAAAWGDPAIVLRCGVPRPAALTPGSSLLLINGVTWLTETGADNTTVWTAVDRQVYIDVQVPSAQASGPVALLSTIIAGQLPGTEPNASPAPTR